MKITRLLKKLKDNKEGVYIKVDSRLKYTLGRDFLYHCGYVRGDIALDDDIDTDEGIDGYIVGYQDGSIQYCEDCPVFSCINLFAEFSLNMGAAYSPYRGHIK